MKIFENLEIQKFDFQIFISRARDFYPVALRYAQIQSSFSRQY